MAVEIEKKIAKLIGKYAKVSSDPQGIGITDSLESLGIHSMHYVKLIVEIEDEFEIEFDDEYLDLRKLPNIQSIASYVAEKMNL